MKRHYLLQSFVLAILITNTLYASTYEYSFCYGNSASQSTYGDGTWGSILEIIVWINTNNTVTAKIQKKDRSNFSTSGYIYLQGMSPDEDPPALLRFAGDSQKLTFSGLLSFSFNNIKQL